MILVSTSPTIPDFIPRAIPFDSSRFEGILEDHLQNEDRVTTLFHDDRSKSYGTVVSYSVPHKVHGPSSDCTKFAITRFAESDRSMTRVAPYPFN